MSAGHAVRRSLRAGRVRIALGATVVAAALTIGGTFAAHADNSEPVPQRAVQAPIPGDCAEPAPVDAVPSGSDDVSDPDAKDVQIDMGSDEGPVEAVPGDVCAEPGPDEYVDAVLDESDDVSDPDAKDAQVDYEFAQR
ncbi:hypothetical protein OG548_29960 [Streptomyces sp. NBC_01356]|uniref:hypothetical protein n=1 Tax=Streptomyces sp. NBC_01356 TaxID=2903836 RepID=UPI002E35A6DB|nr:hypothetical protein [Streptomyces sp. NBC_01356]